MRCSPPKDSTMKRFIILFVLLITLALGVSTFTAAAVAPTATQSRTPTSTRTPRPCIASQVTQLAGTLTALPLVTPTATEPLHNEDEDIAPTSALGLPLYCYTATPNETATARSLGATQTRASAQETATERAANYTQPAPTRRPITAAAAVTRAPVSNRPPAATKAPAQQQAPAQPTMNNATVGPTALCKDGTYSYAQHHRGACSHHGGVRQFFS